MKLFQTVCITPQLCHSHLCCSIPRTAAWLIPRLCPLKFSLLLLPSDGGSGSPSPPFSPPLPVSPRFPVPCSFHVDSLSFLCLLSVRVIQSTLSPQQRLIPRRPSGGLLRWTSSVDVDQCPPLGSSAPKFWWVLALCSWCYLSWVWVRGRRRRPPSWLSLRPLTRRQASLAIFFLFRLPDRSYTLGSWRRSFQSWGASVFTVGNWC